MENIITIRPIYNEYCEQVIELILSIQQKEFGLSITIDQQPDLRDLDANYHNGGGTFWGAFVGEELAGTIALINIGHNAGCIRKMFVKTAYRGKEWGTAQKLLDVLLQFCKDNHISDVQLGTVEPLKAAHRFYERNGFERIAKEDLPPYFPLMLTDTLFYQLHLSK
ncbi:GNAT family N-acetyltransferase [Mucilaginibacter corticis]|uniref:GNAT family N-acetyltransferase n=1 Tax=Mucilaginibacter corticis TaxID=2597670 RepID=A0A556MF56_9SPHI|nr:GNAT family N-acetyltransferase [Mucilaginibacter corticis]TSJ38556.1 GNAT family N-acetyltransferase [Mucilaginibacter corticis]